MQAPRTTLAIVSIVGGLTGIALGGLWSVPSDRLPEGPIRIVSPAEFALQIERDRVRSPAPSAHHDKGTERRSDHSAANAVRDERAEREANATAIVRDSLDALGAARAEPRDEEWATETEGLIDKALDGVAEHLDFAAGTVECHTESCTVDIEWPDAPTADVWAGPLMLQVLGDCERQVTSDPADQTDPSTHRSTLLVHCPRDL